ncbi:MAG: hypothetical protein EOM44_14905, partial [Bacteroidia bacterium]|nr:hypothetical protein [Bacteroidia bacterium]
MAQPAALIVKGNLSCEGGIFTLGGSTTVYGNINLNGGSLISSVESPISLKGNWSALSGTSFNHGNGTVNLIGTNQTISGFNTFFNFTKNISATDTLFFDTTAGSTLNVAGNLSLNGAGGNFLSLRSTTPGTQWNINPSGTLNISYLDVMDSNSTSAIDATLGNIIDSGNNTGWIFDNTGPNMSFGAIPTISNDTLFPIFGTASDDNIVSGVNFRTDIIYYPCTANDGSFDESIEDFTCNPISALSDGIHTFYLIAYDINENSGSSGVEKNIIIDTTPPVITAFSVPANSTSTTIEVTDFSVTDANAVAGYLLTETSTVPELNNTGWSSVSQASYAFSSDGTKTLFAWAKDSAGNISASSVASVVISPADTTPPSISSINVIPGVNNVEITWTTNEDSISKIDYGLTNSYGLNVLDSTLKLNHNVLISSLNACTTYHFRIGSRDALLNSSFSPDQTFNTGGCIVADTVPPTIASIVASPDINEASISWMTNEPASSIVEYGTDNNYGQEVSDNTLAHSHNLMISGLNSCTVYYYKVRSLEASSNEGVVSNQSFTTGGCIIPVTDNTTSDTTTSASTVSTVYSSEEDSDSCDLDKPGEPEIISVKARDSKSVILEIDKASGDDDEYEIKYGTVSGDYPWQAEDIDDGEIESFIVNELKAGTDYYFKVRAL